MTSGTSTPAGNYRTKDVICHSQGHAHACALVHTWKMEDTQGTITQQVPIHQADAVFNTWTYAPAANPNWEQGEKEKKILLFANTRKQESPLCHILNYNSQDRPKSPLNYSLWQKQACDGNNNSNINSIPRLDKSWLKQYLM